MPQSIQQFYDAGIDFEGEVPDFWNLNNGGCTFGGSIGAPNMGIIISQDGEGTYTGPVLENDVDANIGYLVLVLPQEEWNSATSATLSLSTNNIDLKSLSAPTWYVLLDDFAPVITAVGATTAGETVLIPFKVQGTLVQKDT